MILTAVSLIYHRANIQVLIQQKQHLDRIILLKALPLIGGGAQLLYEIMA